MTAVSRIGRPRFSAEAVACLPQRKGEIMKVINQVMDWIEDYLLVVLMIVMTGVVMAQVILRLTGGNLKWTEETARYMYIWVIYVGASRAVRNHAELSVDIVRTFFKDASRAQAVYDTLRTAMCIVFSAVFVRYSFAVIQNMMLRPQYSPACQYNMIIVYIPSVLAAALMLIRYLQEIVGDVLRIVNPHRGEQTEGGSAS